MFHILSGTGYLIIWLWKLEILFNLWKDTPRPPLGKYLTIRWDPD